MRSQIAAIMPAMKTLLILILSAALLLVAGITRPKEDEFRTFLRKRAQATQTNIFGKIGAEIWADSYAKDCTFKNRLLYTEVQKEGKTVFTGALGQWWGSGGPEKK